MKTRSIIAVAALAAVLLAAHGAAAAEGAATTAAPPAASPGRYRISILTMGQGKELFARFGHIGFLVDDLVAREQKVYNFGTFDFANPALRFKYLRGQLIYKLTTQSYPGTVRGYRSMDRTLTQRDLDLSPDEAALVATKLAVNARPENREYLYRHYLDNCCTRIRDLVDEASGGAVGRAVKGRPGTTYRDWTRRMLRGPVASAVATIFVLGPVIDQPIDRWAEEFLPVVFSEDLDTITRADGRPLVKKKTALYTRTGPDIDSVREPWDLPIIVAFLLLLALGVALPIALGAARTGLAARLLSVGFALWAFLGGVGGAALLFLWLGTTHYDTYRNENLLVFPPTHLLLIVPALRLLVRAKLSPALGRLTVRYLAACAAVAVAALLLKLRPHPQDNYGFMAFALAIDLALIWALVRARAASCSSGR